MEGARKLSEALKTNTTLKTLKLKGKHKVDTNLAKGLSTLVAGTRLGDRCVQALSEALEHNNTLTELELPGKII